MKHLLISCLLLSAAGTLQAAPKSNIPPLKLWYNKPATAFEESLPIGNGKLGALIYGGANNDSIYLNDITLWTGKPVNREEGGDAYNGYLDPRGSVQRGLQGSRFSTTACTRTQFRILSATCHHQYQRCK